MNFEIILEIIGLFVFVGILSADMISGFVAALFGGIILYFAGENGHFLYESIMNIYTKKGIEEFYGLFIFLGILVFVGILNIASKKREEDYREIKNAVEYAPYFIFINILFFGNMFYYIAYLFIWGMLVYYDYEYDAVRKVAKTDRI